MNEIIGEDKIVDIEQVKPNTWNPKDSIDENPTVRKMYEQIKEEIRKKGLFEAITVRSVGNKYEILDGYHRWRACKELGYERIRINTLGKVSDRLARAITVVKEQKKVPVSQLGVADILGWYQDEGIGADIVQDLLGYSEEEFNSYSTLFDFDLGEVEDEKEKHKKGKISCPECGHRFEL